jgi:hypothetical protein
MNAGVSVVDIGPLTEALHQIGLALNDRFEGRYGEYVPSIAFGYHVSSLLPGPLAREPAVFLFRLRFIGNAVLLSPLLLLSGELAGLMVEFEAELVDFFGQDRKGKGNSPCVVVA